MGGWWVGGLVGGRVGGRVDGWAGGWADGRAGGRGAWGGSGVGHGRCGEYKASFHLGGGSVVLDGLPRGVPVVGQQGLCPVKSIYLCRRLSTGGGISMKCRVGFPDRPLAWPRRPQLPVPSLLVFPAHFCDLFLM